MNSFAGSSSDTQSEQLPVPIVSVCMPAYNAAKYIDGAIRSIVEQTFDAFEFVIVDDGSSDATKQKLVAWQARDKRIRVFFAEHQGCYPSRNKAMKEARGEFIAIMDADDLSRSYRLERQIAFLRSHPNVVAVGGAVLNIDSGGRPIWVTHHPTDPATIDRLLLGEDLAAVLHPATMVRRSAIMEVGGYQENYDAAQDLDLFLKLSEIGQLANLAEIVHERRRHFASISVKRIELQEVAVKAAIREACTRRGLDMVQIRARSMPSESERLIEWARKALDGGYFGTSMWMALELFRVSPFSLMPWKIAVKAFLKRS